MCTQGARVGEVYFCTAPVQHLVSHVYVELAYGWLVTYGVVPYFGGFIDLQAKLEQAKLAAKVMNVATPGTSSCSGSACSELKGSNVQSELKSMQHGLGMSRQLA